jgi:lon-related putative ATP-dependent protease
MAPAEAQLLRERALPALQVRARQRWFPRPRRPQRPTHAPGCAGGPMSSNHHIGTRRADVSCVASSTIVTAAVARRTCSPEEIPFATTADAPGLATVELGQERALKALRFGTGIRQHGYNLFAAGRSGVGKQTMLRSFLQQQTRHEVAAIDICYVHDFAHPEAPRMLALAAGLGVRLQSDMGAAVAELRANMQTALESEEHRSRRQRVLAEFSERQALALAQARARAAQRDVAVKHSNSGVEIAPIHAGKALDPEAFRLLPEAEQQKLRGAMEEVGEELQSLLGQFHDWGRAQQEALLALDKALLERVARRALDPLRETYAGLPAVLAYLSQVELDVVESAPEFLAEEPEGFAATLQRAFAREHEDGPAMRRYQVNVLVPGGSDAGVPVVYEDNPTHANLMGRIEHETQFGTLVTNFTLIKAGAFHRANGGYLLLDALKVLQQPFAWEAVKRTIRSGEIRIEPLGESLGLVSMVSLRPEPIPLGDTKVVLLGERVLYYLLAALDPEFSELFKVLVDFEETIERRPETQAAYARMLAALVSSKGLRPFDRAAVARVIDQATRAASDSEQLSLHMRAIVDLLREADYWASEGKREVVCKDDVQQAIGAHLERAGRMRDRLQEAIARGDLQIETSGDSVGQINGLSVFQLGELAFGHPTRITACVRAGRGELVDIEREVKLGGPLHSKGVLILSGFLSGHYATSTMLSLNATLVFEQSYGAIDGDSASLAELCALLSAIAQVPLRQSLAVTGSVDQHGRVQAIGAVNEKIEGFFDVCRQRGLTGEQGVIIPRSNVKNLMVRQEVAEAIEAGRFRIHAVGSVDEALELLSGRQAGVRDAGQFPEDCFNRLVEARLISFAELAHKAARGQP